MSLPMAGSRQLVEQMLRLFEIGGVEALGKASRRRGERSSRASPRRHCSRHSRAGPVAERNSKPRVLLLSGDRESGAGNRVLGLDRIGIWQPTGELAAQSMNFCTPAPSHRRSPLLPMLRQSGEAFPLFFRPGASASASRVRKNGVFPQEPVASHAATPSRIRAIPVVASPLWASAQPWSVRLGAANQAK